MATKSTYDINGIKVRAKDQSAAELLAAEVAASGGGKTTVPATTAGQAYKDFNAGGGTSEEDNALAALLENSKKSALGRVPSESELYNQKLALYQGEIDAISKIYADKLAEQTTQNTSDMGSGRAIQARSGTLGSDFGFAQSDKIRAAGNNALSSIRDEQTAKIQALLGKARKDAADELAAKRSAQQSGLQDYLTYLGQATERKTTKLTNLANSILDQGLALEDIDPTQLNQVAKDYGIAVADIKAAFATEQKAREAAKAEADAKLIKDRSFNLSEGQDYYQYNPETGTYDLVASKAKTYAPKDGGGSLPGDGTGALSTQPNYSRLTANQKKQADSLNNLVRTLAEYKQYYSDNRGALGGVAGNLVGADSGLLQTKLNSIIFAAAQAEGTGALQAADREVIEKIIPNPTSLGGAWNTLTKGGAEGNIARIQDQVDKYTQNLATYGLTPVVSDSYAAGGSAGGGQVVVQTPDGASYTFPNQAAADAFKAQAGIQ